MRGSSLSANTNNTSQESSHLKLAGTTTCAKSLFQAPTLFFVFSRASIKRNALRHPSQSGKSKRGRDALVIGHQMKKRSNWDCLSWQKLKMKSFRDGALKTG